jgi:glycosyltransferase involved in cell wall biosynthesis
MNPTLSIVIPYYNEEQVLQNCLNSLINQTVPPEEIILVDNNSTDNSTKIVKSFISKFSRHHTKLHVFSCTTQGIVPTRQIGFSKASNEIIGTIDADCIPCKKWVEIIKSNYLADPHIVALTGPTTAYTHNIISDIYNSNVINYISEISPFFRTLCFSNGAFTRDSWIKLNGLKDFPKVTKPSFMNVPHEDYFFSEKLKLLHPIKYNRRLLVYRRNNDSIVHILDQIISYPQIYFYVQSKTYTSSPL